jgi:protein-tyrosine phosphatase
MGVWSDRLLEELAGVQRQLGLVPVVAHIDRYLTRFNARRVMSRMAELPVFLQANSSFFLERSTCRMAMRFLCDHRIHVIGSDCHDEKHRPPNLGEAARVIANKAGESWLTQLYQNSIEFIPNN